MCKIKLSTNGTFLTFHLKTLVKKNKKKGTCRKFFEMNKRHFADLILMILLCLMPLSAIFQLYHGDQF
jgi:hypothetical protein